MIAACGQMEATTIDQAEKVWPALDRLIDAARAASAQLLVLPEITYPAYWLESPDRYFRPDIERSPQVIERFKSLAAHARLWLVAGFVEEQGGRLFNSAAVIDATGQVVGIARKNFLWDCDNRWFAPGEKLLTVDTPWGRMGVLICADARAPEIAATLVQDGATFIVQPTAWVNAARQPGEYRNIQAEFLIRARALEFGVPFLSADKSGREGRVLDYVGQSLIVDATGRELARAPIHGEHLITATIIPGATKPAKLADKTRERLLRIAPAPCPPNNSTITSKPGSLTALKSELERGGAKTVEILVPELSTFVPARCAALDGAQVIWARGRVDDDLFARTRAAENRVFVVVGDQSIQFIAHPDGSILWTADNARDQIEIRLADANLKKFTPETDLWEQRRVSAYSL